jgi:hypothetical protein
MGAALSAVFQDFTPAHAYALSGAIGALIGTGEILSRYRDAPFRAVATWAGAGYVAFNALIAIVALAFLHLVLPLWSDTPPPEPDAGDLVRNSLVAGFGAMAVLRSSILTTRAGARDVEIGPAAVIDIFRHAMDRSIARLRASNRATEVVAIMAPVRFDRSNAALANISMALLQSIDAEERAAIEQQISALSSQPGRSDRDKSLELGLIIAGACGFPTLKASIEALGDRVMNAERRPDFVATQMARIPLDVTLRDLPATCLALNTDVRAEDQESLSKQIDEIAASGMSDTAKRVNVGLVIVTLLGEESLKSAVDLLRVPVPTAPDGAAGGPDPTLAGISVPTGPVS